MQIKEYLLILFEFVWYLFLILFHALVGFTLFCIPNALRPKKDVSGDVVLVTGGGCGFGRLFALEFTKLGSTVVIWDVNLPGAQAVVKECQDLGGKAYAYEVDVSKSEEVYKTADRVRRDVGDVTILINNAGVVSGRYLLDAPDELINRTLDINVKSHFWTVKAFAKSMLDNNRGHFVSVASMAGHYGGTQITEYSASKHAVVGFEDSIYMEFELYKRSGVFSTIISPFYMSTGMFDGIEKTAGLLPIMTPEYVMRASMDAILTNQRFVFLPPLTRLYLFMRSFLPEASVRAMISFLRIEGYMSGYVGRPKNK